MIYLIDCNRRIHSVIVSGCLDEADQLEANATEKHRTMRSTNRNVYMHTRCNRRSNMLYRALRSSKQDMHDSVKTKGTTPQPQEHVLGAPKVNLPAVLAATLWRHSCSCLRSRLPSRFFPTPDIDPCEPLNCAVLNLHTLQHGC